MSDLEQAAPEKNDSNELSAEAKRVQRVVVIGGGLMSMGLARLIAHCGDRIEVVSPEDIGLSTNSLPMPHPIKDICAASLCGAQPGKGRKSRKNRENRWR